MGCFQLTYVPCGSWESPSLDGTSQCSSCCKHVDWFNCVEDGELSGRQRNSRTDGLLEFADLNFKPTLSEAWIGKIAKSRVVRQKSHVIVDASCLWIRPEIVPTHTHKVFWWLDDLSHLERANLNNKSFGLFRTLNFCAMEASILIYLLFSIRRMKSEREINRKVTPETSCMRRCRPLKQSWTGCFLLYLHSPL